MSLDHLTEEEKEEILKIYPKKLESVDEGVSEHGEPVIKPEIDKSKVVSKEKKEDWKAGYIDYEVKNKQSDRLSYEDSEIEILEED